MVASANDLARPTLEVEAMPEIPTPKTAAEDLTKLLKDAFYVTVGLGVIVAQRAQVRRQELSKVFEDRFKLFEERLDDVESRVDAVLDRFEERLPEGARDVAKQARSAAKDARTQARNLVNRGAA
jgi:hypothetical protein